MYPVSPESYSQSPTPAVRSKKKLKIGNGNACELCRVRKVKCDGGRPSCANCKKRTGRCIYTTSRPIAQCHDSVSRASAIQCMILGCAGSHEGFANKIREAIDERFGTLSDDAPREFPLKDALLFSQGSLPEFKNSNKESEPVLPPRRQADHLVDIYWQHVQPCHLCLDKKRFFECYTALYSGTCQQTDERTFMSTLNLIFAFATQAQESLVADARTITANTYFQRALDLIRPECLFWEPASPELVECLLLMSRYLQCLGDVHRTFMVIGVAVRMAQSVGLHLPAQLSNCENDENIRWHQRLWKCCCFTELDISSTLSNGSSLTLQSNSLLADGSLVTDDNFLASMELSEIIRHIKISQSPEAHVPDRLGLPPMQPKRESYCHAVTQLDACLSRWEQLRQSPLISSDGDGLFGQRLALHLRFLLARLTLFRPVLARRCFEIQVPKAPDATTQGDEFKERFIKHGSEVCITTAQEIISLLSTYSSGDSDSVAVGVIPWWCRTFYLHVASFVLLAAMLRAEFNTPALSESWSQVMAVLKRDGSLCAYNRQCTALFHSLQQTLSGKYGEDKRDPDSSSYASFEDISHDFIFNPDSFLFGEGDTAWLDCIK